MRQTTLDITMIRGDVELSHKKGGGGFGNSSEKCPSGHLEQRELI